MKKLMRLFFLSCRKTTELIEKRLVVPLSFKEKMQLRMHKSMCDACTLYERQSKKVDELLKLHIHDNGNKSNSVQNEDLKKRILRHLSL